MTLQYFPIEYWAKADAKLAAMGLPELVDTYEGQVCETRRLAGLARLPDVLSQQEHHAVYARKALEELRRHGLPERVYRRCCRAWQYSDADWADTQRQIESWASKPEPDAGAAGPGEPSNNDPLENDPMGKAMLLIKNQQGLSNSEVAKIVGVHPKTLNKPKWKPYRILRDSMRQGGSPPDGSKTKDGDIEAWEHDRGEK